MIHFKTRIHIESENREKDKKKIAKKQSHGHIPARQDMGGQLKWLQADNIIEQPTAKEIYQPGGIMIYGT